MKSLLILVALILLAGCENTAPIRDLCVPPPQPRCSTDADCPDGNLCQSGTCQDLTATDGVCKSDDDCTSTSLCNTKTGACYSRHSEFCKTCASDADCVIGGNPCCNADHRWYCYNANIEGLTFCDDTCDLVPDPPPDNRCSCIAGFCSGG